ncbi:MAG: MotA/TolQ/ExbB proton channel family protein [Bdellovibrionales bacterium]|nr:MotA/TolQ/ExbB proton channel family protein [Bdellovibrionales bacterium]
MLTDKFFMVAEAGHEATLWVLIGLSVLSVAFILERFLSIRKLRISSRKMSERIRETLNSNNLEELEELSRDRETLEGRALANGLRYIKANGSSGLEEIFNSFSRVEKQDLEKHLNFLATVGSNAPFIGLLGTVFGIMDAFRGLATSQGDAAAVMIGISKALVATAIGLIVAIPAVIAYNYFNKQVRSIFQGLEGLRDICVAYSKSGKGKA